jgi:hypothetical protein
MGVYDVSSANTNRIVRFRVEAVVVGNANAALFGILKGRNDSYPNYGRLTTVPTANQELAALRLSLVARALSRYAVPVGIRLCNDSFATGAGDANFAPAFEIDFETNERGEFYSNAWATATTGDKHLPSSTSDGTPGTYADTVGVGGMTTTKTKPDLNGLLASLATITYGGGTGPFGTLSASGNITLPGGAVTAGAPVLSNGVGTNASGLKVRYIAGAL